MVKLVVLKLDGDLQIGYQVTLEIGEENKRPTSDLQGKLPSHLELLQAYNNWRSNYRRLDGRNRIKAKPGQLTNVSLASLQEDCRKAALNLQERFNLWLQTDSFRPIKEKCLESLTPDDEVRLLVRSTCRIVPRLPWQRWDLVERYDKIEIAFSLLASEDKGVIRRDYRQNKIKILAILGNNEGIDLEKDRKNLKRLAGAQVTFLNQPYRHEISDRLWDKHWDIIFFSGHSETKEETGLLHLNATESLTVADLKEGLKKAIKRGLQIAIFNSCDGLGLAWELQTLHIPQAVVMREPVPDAVAQQFLQYFLKEFSGGKSFYQAVGNAKKQLQGLEDKYPCASWLPLIIQNAATTPPTWHHLRYGDRLLVQKRLLQVAAIASLLVTGGIMGARQTGFFQPFELKTYDSLVKLRALLSPEPKDPRLLIVAIAQADLEYQDRAGMNRKNGESLSDRALAQLLQKLVSYQPRVIGLDLYRDRAIDPQYRKIIQQTEQLIGLCQNQTIDGGSIAPLPEIVPERIGFIDIFPDDDRVLRRQVYGIAPNRACNTKIAFSLLVALHYLAWENIGFTPENSQQLGQAILNPIEDDAGGYQLSDERAAGKAIMLNYRANAEVAAQVTLEEIFSDRLKPEQVKDRIVLIGTVVRASRDYHATPYSDDVPGVIINAHAISQIVSAALGERPLITYWSQSEEFLWTWVWGLIGGLIAWRSRSLSRVGVAMFLSALILSGACYVFLVRGIWVIFIPPLLSGFTTGGIVLFYRNLWQKPRF